MKMLTSSSGIGRRPMPLPPSMLAAVLGVSTLLLVGTAWAEDAFQVNSYTTGNQLVPVATTAADGSFVVLWNSFGSPDTDSESTAIVGRRFGSDGQAIGTDFQVNSTTVGYQVDPELAFGADGTLFTVWTDGPTLDNATRDIFGQLYDSVGNAMGGEFVVNSLTTGAQGYAGFGGPSIAALDDGSFVVAFDSESSTGSDSDGLSLQMRFFDSVGTPAGADTQVNTVITTADQSYPDLAAVPAGFVVVWSSGVTDPFGFGETIRGRRYANDGTALGEPFQVDTYTTGAKGQPAVAAGPDGSFVVTWSSRGEPTGGMDETGIRARRFGSDGTAIGDDFQVFAEAGRDERVPDVVVERNGRFHVVWHADTDQILGRAYTADGQGSTGLQVYPNSAPAVQRNPAVVAFEDRDGFLITWGATESAGTDSDGTSIQGRLETPNFADGFESGTVSAWSSSTPVR